MTTGVLRSSSLSTQAYRWALLTWACSGESTACSVIRPSVSKCSPQPKIFGSGEVRRHARGRVKYSSRSLLSSVSLTSWPRTCGEDASRTSFWVPRPVAAASMAYWVLATVGWAARSDGISAVAARQSSATAMNVFA